jgi:hypothetical protein
MEKRSIDGRNSFRVEVVVDDAPVQEAETPKTVRIVLLKNYNPFIVRGSATGNIYKFLGVGYSLDIDKEDAEGLLNKRQETSCCVGTIGSPYFSLV